jgi:hypothetical protein
MFVRATGILDVRKTAQPWKVIKVLWHTTHGYKSFVTHNPSKKKIRLPQGDWHNISDCHKATGPKFPIATRWLAQNFRFPKECKINQI